MLPGDAVNAGYLVGEGGAFDAPVESASWPIVRAFAPVADVWTSSGYGTAGVVRQRPDGLFAEAAFCFNGREGLTSTFGKLSHESLADLLLANPEFTDGIPPFEPSTPERAAAFLWAAVAEARSQGAMFPGLEGYLRLAPPAPDPDRGSPRRFSGPDGLSPRGLADILAGLPLTAFGDKTEPAIFTTLSFGIDDPAAAAGVIEAHAPAFRVVKRSGDEVEFDWSRRYPAGHWSPMAKFGGRQLLGRVVVQAGELIAESKSLSFVARLVALLQRLVGGGLRLRTARWVNPSTRLERQLAVG